MAQAKPSTFLRVATSLNKNNPSKPERQTTPTLIHVNTDEALKPLVR